MTSVPISSNSYKEDIPGGLSDDRLTWNFPPIVNTARNGQDIITNIIVRLENANNKFVIILY